ncbi:hypothetical protein GJAV_G00140240 [Gymnothorax javanicus]|nr:hypothetical protein GJAV_G00140240 [Gymnothorax javanicus]
MESFNSLYKYKQSSSFILWCSETPPTPLISAPLRFSASAASAQPVYLNWPAFALTRAALNSACFQSITSGIQTYKLVLRHPERLTLSAVDVESLRVLP